MPEVAKAERHRSKRWSSYVSWLFILLCLGGGGYYAYSNGHLNFLTRYFREPAIAELSANDIKSVSPGTIVELNGGVEVGYVSHTYADAKTLESTLRIEFNDPVIARRIMVEGTEFYISSARMRRAGPQAVERLLPGPRIIIVPGKLGSKPKTNFTLHAHLPPDPRITHESRQIVVRWKSVHGLQIGDYVQHAGVDVGQVRKVIEEGDWAFVTIDFFGSLDESRALCVPGSRFRIDRFEGRKLEFKGLEREFFGPVVWLMPGDPSGEALAEFVGEEGLPLDAQVSNGSPRIQVTWNTAYRLESGDWVFDRNGLKVGQVETVSLAPGGEAVVTIAFFGSDADTALYRRSGSRYFVNRFAVEGLTVKAPLADVQGASIVVVPDSSNQQVVASLNGESSLPPDPRVRPDSIRVQVEWQYVHGLRENAYCYALGEQVGQIVSCHRTGSRVKVEIAFFESDLTHCDLVREGASYYINRFATERLNVRGFGTELKGTDVVIVPGNPEGQVLETIKGSSMLPPPEWARWNQVKATVEFDRVFTLDPGAPVRGRGGEIGYVSSIDTSNGHKTIAHIVLKTVSAESSPYTREHCRYYINNATLSHRGVEGDVSTVFERAHLVAVPDPLHSSAAVSLRFAGQSGNPPMILPRIGEKEFTMVSDRWVDADTAISHDGGLAGYVHHSEKADGSAGYFVHVRIFRPYQSRVCQNTKFYWPRTFDAQLFQADGLFDWQGPQVKMPTLRDLIIPSIEFKTPADSGYSVFDLSKAPLLRVHAEPEEGWEAYFTALAPTDDTERAERMGMPSPFWGRFNWRGNYLNRFTSDDAAGTVLAVPGGYIAPTELLSPDGKSDSDVTVLKFQLQGEDASRTYSTMVGVAPGVSFMKTKPRSDLKTWNLDRIASTREITSVWFVDWRDMVHGIDRRFLSKNGSTWNIDNSFKTSRDWHGAPVLCADPTNESYGRVIGVLLVPEDGEARVSLFYSSAPGKLSS